MFIHNSRLFGLQIGLDLWNGSFVSHNRLNRCFQLQKKKSWPLWRNQIQEQMTKCRANLWSNQSKVLEIFKEKEKNEKYLLNMLCVCWLPLNGPHLLQNVSRPIFFFEVSLKKSDCLWLEAVLLKKNSFNAEKKIPKKIKTENRKKIHKRKKQKKEKIAKQLIIYLNLHKNSKY